MITPGDVSFEPESALQKYMLVHKLDFATETDCGIMSLNVTISTNSEPK
jgi:hypothetical protein